MLEAVDGPGRVGVQRSTVARDEAPSASGPLSQLAVTIGVGLSTIDGMMRVLGYPGLARLGTSNGLDANRLTNVVFFLRHPEMRGRPIRRGERALAREWIQIRDEVVRPLLDAVGPSAPTPEAEPERATGDTAAPPSTTSPEPQPERLRGDERTRLWEEDWIQASDAERRRFRGDGRPPGTPRQRYDVLCPLYAERGIDRPMKYVQDNIVEATFFGRRTPAHRDLAARLAEAETHYRETRDDTPIRRAWAFNPRTTSRGSWSNHADGRAIDVDAPWNPHLTNLQHRLVIFGLTDVPIHSGDVGYDQIMEASDLFRERYNPAGLRAAIERHAALAASGDEDHAMLERALQRALRNYPQGRLARYQRQGFLNLSEAFVESMKAVGLRWGGDWKGSKDFMHFDLR